MPSHYGRHQAWVRVAVASLALATCTHLAVARGLADKEPAAHAKKPLDELKGRVDQAAQAIRENIESAWSHVTCAQQSAGHLMVGLNEVRKYNRNLRRQIEERERDENPLLGSAPEPTVEAEVVGAEQGRPEVTYKELAEQARQEVQAVSSERGQLLKESLEKIERRTHELVKSLFLEEIRDTAELLVILCLERRTLNSNNNPMMKITQSLQSKLLKFIVGVFVDLGRRLDPDDPILKFDQRDSWNDYRVAASW